MYWTWGKDDKAAGAAPAFLWEGARPNRLQ
jgi:hypothetical protein